MLQMSCKISTIYTSRIKKSPIGARNLETCSLKDNISKFNQIPTVKKACTKIHPQDVCKPAKRLWLSIYLDMEGFLSNIQKMKA